MLEEGPQSQGVDRALGGLRFAIAGAFVGGAVAGAGAFSPGANIIGGGFAGGFVSLGMGLGFASGYGQGVITAGVLEGLFGAAGYLSGRLSGWVDSFVVGGAASRVAYGWKNLLRVLKGRGLTRSLKPISPQKQARHAQDWAPNIDVDSVVNEAYMLGVPVPNKPHQVVHDTGRRIGKNGETKVKVHVAKKGIHGHPDW